MYSFQKWFYVVCFVLVHCFAHAQDEKLWYNKPAKEWTDALPIGNGRLGAMIYGGVEEEHIQFNESTLWTGKPSNNARKGAYKYLSTIRTLLAEGRQKEAEDLAQAHFMGVMSNETNYDTESQTWLQKIRNDSTIYLHPANYTKGKTIKLPMLAGWEREGLDGIDGAVWFYVAFDVPQSLVGKDLKVYLGKIRDDDYTYLNGHLIGQTKGMNLKREYSIPAHLLKAGRNILSVQVINWFDKGGFSGTKDGRKLFVLYSADKSSKDTISLGSNWNYIVQNQSPPEYPRYAADYQPFGDVYLRFPVKNISQYKRSLNIADATASVEYETNGVQYKRAYFASNPQRSIVMHFSANKSNSLNFSVGMSSVQPLSIVRSSQKNVLQLNVAIKNGALKGTAILFVTTKNGTVNTKGNTLEISNANEATIYLVAATNFKSYKDVSGDPNALCEKYLQPLKTIPYQEVRNAHIKDYQTLYQKFSVSLGDKQQQLSAQRFLPTDERILQYDVQKDPGLIALYMQYARYLLIASSRSDSPEPANLQGLWNNLLTPPWGSKFTTNINLEMNYWPADALQLSSCSAPFFNLIEDISNTGTVVAKEHYGLDGWILHHNTDIWRTTAPINASNHGIWVGGAAWMCYSAWDHFLYSRDTAFLRKMYPVIKNATRFYAGFLVYDSASKHLISSPSNSPEHGGLVAGPTMDHQMIRSLFSICVQSGNIIGEKDRTFLEAIKNKIPQIEPNRIGHLGQLQEWLHDVDDPTDKHRHISHLWGVYPGTDISWSDSALMMAARKSMQLRGDSGTGWSLAWKLNVWARFKDSDHAMKILDDLLAPADKEGFPEKGGIYKNMMDAHPPFQIDGNLGGAAGIAELLLQSQNGVIELLPALPKSLPDGDIRGLEARGALSVDMDWRSGKLTHITVAAKYNGNYIFSYEGKVFHVNLDAGKPTSLNKFLYKQGSVF